MIKHNKLNDDLSKGERNLIKLTTGKKKPKTDKDQQLLKEINEIKKKGGQIYIPHD